MSGKKHYFSLRFKGGNKYHENGSTLKLTDRIVNIGETPDCDVRYDSDGLQPVYYASIVRNDNGKSWRIVKRSQHVDVSIVGKGQVGFAHQLSDGDIVQFDKKQMSLKFQTHYDNLYDVSSKTGNGKWWLAAIAVLMVAAVVAAKIRTNNDITEKDILPFEESIFLLKVDSVSKLMTIQGQEELLCPSKVFDEDTPTGTAFLTTDGMLVTARHCVEFWLGENLDLTTKVAGLSKDDVVRWAIETETFNQNHQELSDSVMQLKVYFSIYNFLGEKVCSLNSNDSRVHTNRENDGVFVMADFSCEYYWRSINPYFTDRKMALGDILWVEDFGEKGAIKIGDLKVLEKMKRGTRLMVCGYPMAMTNDLKVTMADGTIKQEVDVEKENLVFESNINHGFSGAPMFVRENGDVLAVGVVSRADSVSGGVFKWAVPITQIKGNDKIEEND